jgi:hypothetical protein
MQPKNTHGITDAPTPPQGKTHGHPQPVVDAPSAPKTVTDHEHGSTGKPVAADEERKAKPA